MEVRDLTVLCTILLCSPGLAVSSQGHKRHAGLESSVAFRNVSVSPLSRYPLYMMQLYRSLRTTDHADAVAATPGQNPSWHSSDSVLSLTARGECVCFYFSVFCAVLVSALRDPDTPQLLPYLCYQTLPPFFFFTTPQVLKCLFGFKGFLCFMCEGVYISPQTSLHRGASIHILSCSTSHPTVLTFVQRSCLPRILQAAECLM